MVLSTNIFNDMHLNSIKTPGSNHFTQVSSHFTPDSTNFIPNPSSLPGSIWESCHPEGGATPMDDL